MRFSRNGEGEHEHGSPQIKLKFLINKLEVNYSFSKQIRVNWELNIGTFKIATFQVLPLFLLTINLTSQTVKFKYFKNEAESISNIREQIRAKCVLNFGPFKIVIFQDILPSPSLPSFFYLEYLQIETGEILTLDSKLELNES